MNLNNVEFLISAASTKDFPDTQRKEIAFAGKSNVGKSSVINRVLQRKNFARVGEMPGKTIHVNYFLVDKKCYFVDLPGYGYSKRSKSKNEQLEHIISSYILDREAMTLLFVLIDCRHEPQKIDIEFFQWLGENGVPFSIIFTKADKLTKTALASNIASYKKRLLEDWEELPPVFITSSETGLGREELLEYISEVNSTL